MDSIKLSGSPQQQATQLWEFLKEHEISSESLQIIMPSITTFYKELATCINKDIEADKEITKTVLESQKQILLAMSQGLTSKDICSEDKKIIADLISKISTQMFSIQKEYSDKSVRSKNQILFAGVTAFFCILALLSSKK